MNIGYGMECVGGMGIDLENIDVSNNDLLEQRKKAFVSFIKDIQKELVIKENDKFYDVLFHRGLDLFFKQNKNNNNSLEAMCKLTDWLKTKTENKDGE